MTHSLFRKHMVIKLAVSKWIKSRDPLFHKLLGTQVLHGGIVSKFKKNFIQAKDFRHTMTLLS